ncbi:LAFE_0F09098g1_1 [Lachancea fermentati]|uniref:LAFE_0F09098g1_1 n=1 Tax=Lachancea fermentati TaxID=4955 RepID=A0A1G4MFH4_LACFM|nr:LAFE_0F09098g1_1 [Lachancea fermentati]
MDNSSTPSLVGVSVRSINDTKNPDFCEGTRPSVAGARSSPQLLNKIHSSTQLNKLTTPYSTVDELTREGALLTDDNDVDLDQLITKKTEDISDMKKKQLRKKKLAKVHSPGETPLSSSLTRSSSLVTSTDPIDPTVSPSRDKRVGFDEKAPNETIRNSYGEFIKDSSHRPHLARGESYQTTKGSDEEGEERSGRSSIRKGVSTGYLRSLSRSLSRDAKAAHDIEEIKDARMYSTNNYSISQVELENAPHVIKEEEEEEEEGALMNDEGNEEYSEELNNAAASTSARHD